MDRLSINRETFNHKLAVMAGPTQYILNAGVGFVNLSPHGFRRWAKHYLQCRRDFQAPTGFSPVPYFLLCRAIELQLKALHLENKRQPWVKKDYGHDLMKAYSALAPEHQVLTSAELESLEKANVMYVDKGFEYMNVSDAATGFSRAPDLAVLDGIAAKVIDHDG
jgi:hypothetical protein